jgi:hypothetical protein
MCQVANTTTPTRLLGAQKIIPEQTIPFGWCVTHHLLWVIPAFAAT